MSTAIREFIKAATPPALHRVVWRMRGNQTRVNYSWEVKSGIKITVASTSDWVIYNDIFVDGEYDVPILDCLQKEMSGRPIRVLDLGGNVGFFTLRFIDLARKQERDVHSYRITSVEGSPTIAKELRKRIRLTEGIESSVSIIHGLVGKRSGSAKITENEFHPMSTIMHQDRYGVSVPYIDLNSFLAPNEPIHLLKCDIEGAELEFLENYPELMQNVRSAVFELHPEVCDTDRCIKLLKTAGLVRCEFLRKTKDVMIAYFLR